MVFLGFTMSVVAQMSFCLFDGAPIRRELIQVIDVMEELQLLIIAVVIFDLVFFRFKLTAGDTGRTLLYLLLLFSLVATAVVTAYLKAKWTKKHTFISAMFSW